MAYILFSASAIVLQHKEHVTSLLGKPRQEVLEAYAWDAVPCLSAAMFLIFYGELAFRSRNLLHRSHWRDLGLYMTKAAFIAACVYLVMYRCRQECMPRMFLEFEQHFYRVRWYLRLFAAAAATHSILASALLGTFGLLVQPEEGSPDAAPPGKLLGAIPSSIADAAGLKDRLVASKQRGTAALVALINGCVMPLLLVGMLALWLPQLPLLQRARGLLSLQHGVKSEV